MFPNEKRDYHPENRLKLFCAKCQKYIERVQSYADPILLRLYLQAKCHGENIEFQMDSVTVRKQERTGGVVEVTV